MERGQLDAATRRSRKIPRSERTHCHTMFTVNFHRSMPSVPRKASIAAKQPGRETSGDLQFREV
jgi:hypothetical protein